MIPIFTDEVFVIWSAKKNLEIIDSSSVHLKAFFEMLALASKNDPEVKITNKEPVLPDQGKYFTFAELSDSELKEAMDRFWRNGGYVYETLRDRTYYAEIDRYISEFIGDGRNQTILDLCCGKKLQHR